MFLREDLENSGWINPVCDLLPAEPLVSAGYTFTTLGNFEAMYQGLIWEAYEDGVVCHLMKTFAYYAI